MQIAFDPLSLSPTFALSLTRKNGAFVEKNATNQINGLLDFSGNSNHVTGTGATRPIYNATAMNGQPAAYFDGGDQLLWGSAQSVQTVIAVGFKSLTANKSVIASSIALNTLIRFSSSAAPDSPNAIYFNPPNAAAYGPSADWSIPHIITGINYGGAQAWVYYNETMGTPVLITGAPATFKLEVVGNYPPSGSFDLNGFISELWGFSDALTPEQVLQCVNYFKSIYSIS